MKLPVLRLNREQLLPWGLGLLIALLVIGNVKLVIKRYQIQKESDKLYAEQQKLRDSNSDLSKLLEYVRTPAFVEEEARLRFNLAKPGEKIFIVPEGNENAEGTNSETGGSSSNNGTWFSNWWQHFFGNK
ncbi:MAG: septum formation initiator family protein [Patescibacteria group bacterium]|jgi:cell division protein FtsB